MHETTLADRPAGRNFGEGVSESPFGQDAGAGGSSGGSSGGGGGASGLRDQAIDKLRSFADQGKEQVTNSLDGLVEAAREIASKVGDEHSPLGTYAHQAVDTLEGWASGVRSKSVEDLIDDGREFARRSPAVAIGIAVVAGIALSRFLKAGSGAAA